MIYLECYADEALVKPFGATSKMIKHAFSKGEVCNMLRKTLNSVGIVDEDPHAGKPLYEKQMLNHKLFEDHKVIFCEDKRSGNKLVVIKPKLESFIIRLSKENDIDIAKYKLHQILKNCTTSYPLKGIVLNLIVPINWCWISWKRKKL